MLQFRHKIKPKHGFSHLIHVGLNIALPLVAYILVRTDFVSIAVLLILLSKWRMFAVQPRYWIANLIANGVDIMVGVALVYGEYSFWLVATSMDVALWCLAGRA
jgi:hypothetical protein